LFKNKVAIVTGGASGIGREICLYLAKRGAIVVIADINSKAICETANEVKTLGAKCLVKSVDVAKQADVENLVQETKKLFGRIDVMINNAGVGVDGEFKDMTLSHWEKVININLWGVIYGTYAVYPLMMEQGFGQIVNVSSLAGLIPGGLMTSYVATKHAVVGFTLSLRAEAFQYGIKVNALCPGFIETPIHDSTLKVSDYLKSERNHRNKSRFPTAQGCINAIMRGVQRNKAIIVVPGSHKIFWWFYRLCPSLIPYGWMKIIRKLKK
jgi:NAD(P)-dependent dehydrogenase (short-subunit alcohol dehydrogenase family)